MLVLTRKTQQQIQIGENIRITVLQIKGNSVRIGIEAPREVRIARTELVPLTEVPTGIGQSTTLRLGSRLAEATRREPSPSVGFSSPFGVEAPHLAGVADRTARLDSVFIAAHAAAETPDWPRRDNLADNPSENRGDEPRLAGRRFARQSSPSSAGPRQS